MSLGYAPDYDEKELEELEEAVVPLSRDLAGRIQDVVLPGGVSQVVMMKLGRSAQKLVKKQVFYFYPSSFDQTFIILNICLNQIKTVSVFMGTLMCPTSFCC
jgi:hypothetical protein